MRSRDVSIPLALWICAAICAHFLFGTGGLVIATVHEDQSELWKLAHHASGLAQLGENAVEVTLSDSADEAAKSEPPPPAPSPAPSALSPARDTHSKPKPEAVKPPEPKRIVLVKKEEEKTPSLPKDLAKDQRVAVRQHAKPDQDDNPTAHFIADQANRVDQETRASLTSHDRDDEHPDPGASHRSSDSSPGNSDASRVAENAARAGEKNRAPGERGHDLDVQREPQISKASQVAGPLAAATVVPGGPTAPRSDPQLREVPSPAPHPQVPVGGSTPASPDVPSTPGGTWSFNPVQPSGASGANPAMRAGAAGERPAGGRMWSLPGLGQSAPVGGAFNTNLNEQQVASIVGEDNFRRIREADGERRKSEHRGSWAASNFDKWRSAIENYVSTVREGNQTALNAARVPFATYLNGIHNRIHPIFAESFLESLDNLPPSHPLNDQTLFTRLEIVLTREGRLKKMGVVKTSGITAFDIAALDSVDRAQPFGPAPSAIISPDGNVYLHWEFHRDHVYACSTQNASPYILNLPAANPEVPPAPVPGRRREEQGAPPASPNDSRQGSLIPARSRTSAEQSGT